MILDQFIILFLFLLTGFFCKKYGVFSDSAINGINKFVVNIGFPSLILVRTTTLVMSQSVFVNFLLAIAITLGLFFLFSFYAKFLCRGKIYPADDKSVSEMAVFSPNNGFMGFPVATAFYGSMGLLYMVGCNIALNTMIFTYGIRKMKKSDSATNESKGNRLSNFLLMLVHPKVSAAIIGLILCYNHVVLPASIDGFLSAIGGVSTPMAMISVGTYLASSFSLASFKKRIVMEPALNKILLIPVVSAVIVWFLPIDPLLKTILIISNTMPVAAVVPILSEQYGRNKGFAGEMLVISTILSMATIPFFVWIIDLLI